MTSQLDRIEAKLIRIEMAVAEMRDSHIPPQPDSPAVRIHARGSDTAGMLIDLDAEQAARLKRGLNELLAHTPATGYQHGDVMADCVDEVRRLRDTLP